MKRILTFVPAAALVLAACGGDTCTSNLAKLKNSSGSGCTLSPGSTATIQVQLCGRCNDSTPSCKAEFVNGQLEVSPVVQQCAEQAGCAVDACNVTVPVATCDVVVPATGSFDSIVVVGDASQFSVPLSLQNGGGSSCTL